MSSNVVFKKSSITTGNNIKLDTSDYPLTEGTLYFTADQEIYLDNEDSRKQFAGNIIYQDLDNMVDPDDTGVPPTFGGHTVDEFLLKTDNIIPEISMSYVTVNSNNTNIINIPSSITDYENLMVYQNGLLLNEGINYSVNNSNKNISLLGYTAKAGEIFTFTGPTYANDNPSGGNTGTPGSISIINTGLFKSLWDSQSLRYTLYANEIDSNISKQIIQISPYTSSLEEYAACEVQCISQSQGILNFSCSSIPNNNLDIYIIIQTI